LLRASTRWGSSWNYIPAITTTPVTDQMDVISFNKIGFPVGKLERK
jgi:hypothetical protein